MNKTLKILGIIALLQFILSVTAMWLVLSLGIFAVGQAINDVNNTPTPSVTQTDTPLAPAVTDPNQPPTTTLCQAPDDSWVTVPVEQCQKGRYYP